MNLILIHGAWHDAWVWDPILPYLGDFQNVIALSLPGRTPEASKAYKKIDLTTHVDAIGLALSALEGPSMLVGHSLAGLSISQAAENHPDKIAKLMYVAAFVPQDGECMMDITKPIQTKGISTELSFEPALNRINIQKSERTKMLFYGSCQEKGAELALARLTPEPLKVFSTKVRLTDQNYGRVPKIYIKCLDDLALLESDQNRMIQKADFEEVMDLKADHSPFLSDPEAFARLIMSCAST